MKTPVATSNAKVVGADGKAYRQPPTLEDTSPGVVTVIQPAARKTGAKKLLKKLVKRLAKGLIRRSRAKGGRQL